MSVSSGRDPVAFQVVDLAFGDCGKGTMVDYLVRKHGADLVVRFNGGPQAGHNVVLPDGRHHTFAQFGSGSFIPGVCTLLSRFMVIEPYAMLSEARHLEALAAGDVMGRTWIDERCRVITPPQQVANRVKARAAGNAGHGTCGVGFGECVSDSIEGSDECLRAGDFEDAAKVRRKLRESMVRKREALSALREHATAEEARVLDDDAWIDVAVEACGEVRRRAHVVSGVVVGAMLREARASVFEGAQGVLLDERYGFHPHTTWSGTTFENADAVLDDAGTGGERRRVGVMRTYMTRHGAGPLPTHRADMNALPEPHNSDAGWQGAFRRGLLDLMLLRYAVEACGRVDALAVTHADRLGELPGVWCDGYGVGGKDVGRIPLDQEATLEQMERLGRWLGQAKVIERSVPSDLTRWREEVERRLGVPVRYASVGPTYLDKLEFT